MSLKYIKTIFLGLTHIHLWFTIVYFTLSFLLPGYMYRVPDFFRFRFDVVQDIRLWIRFSDLSLNPVTQIVCIIPHTHLGQDSQMKVNILFRPRPTGMKRVILQEFICEGT